MVLAIGILTSQQAARRKSLPKPVIAPLVIDPVLQAFPLLEGRSARHNFAYVADFHSVANEVRAFHEIVGFKYMVALVNDALLAALPALTTKAPELAAELKVRIGIVRAGDDVNALLASIPAGVDAVYITPLRFSDAQLRELAQGLQARKLPTFSVVGRSEVEAGVLMTTGGAERDTERLARRVAIMIQRISQGEDPATFEVGFPTSQRLLINMQVARAIGFSPRWQYLADAEQLLTDSGDAQPLTLLGAMRAALDANPALAASRERLGSALDDVNIARSGLLPSLSASAARTRIDEDRASPLTQAEDSTSTALEFSQVIYSERAWAGYSIAKSLGAAQEQSQRTDMLDTLTDSAAAYLNVLRAKSFEDVRRRNAENTRRNLEISRVREEVGLARALRLSALGVAAGARQADAAVRGSESPPGGDRVAAHPAPAREPALPHHGSRHRRSAGTGGESAHAGVPRHPLEVGGFHGIRGAHGAAERTRNQAGRGGSHGPATSAELGRARLLSTGSGAGVERNEVHWRRAGQARFRCRERPTMKAGAYRCWRLCRCSPAGSAARSVRRHATRCAPAKRTGPRSSDGIEARTRLVLHRTASSWPAIDLSREAQAAADENLANVTEAYARGAVSVTDLIDAQETALIAGLSASDAKYGFVTDFVQVLRSMGEFEILLDPASREAWYARVETWFREHPPQ